MISCLPEESLSISDFAEDKHAAGMLDDIVLPGVDGEDFAAVGYRGRPVLAYGHLHHVSFGELCNEKSSVLKYTFIMVIAIEKRRCNSQEAHINFNIY